MSGPVAVVLFFLGVVVVILIHELGHYVMARRFDFKVVEYFIGFGPRLWSTRRGGIEYGVKAFPLGGYVKIAGMNPWETVAPDDVPRAYFSKPAWQRALVIFAGPFTHALLGAILFTLALGIFGKPAIEIVHVQPIDGRTSSAQLAGLQPGDIVERVAGVEIGADGDRIGEVQAAHVGEPIRYVVRRDGRPVTTTVTPVRTEVEGEPAVRIGVVIGGTDTPVGPIEAVGLGIREVGTTAVESVRTIGRVFGPEGIGSVFRALFTNQPRAAEGPTSVVGIGQAVGEAGASGEWALILRFFGYVTVFIGLLNLVPLPPFDGGHLLLIAIEKLRGRPVDFRRVVPVSVAVLSFLAVFVGATVLLDIVEPITRAP